MIICQWKDILKYAPILPGVEEAFARVNALTSLEPATYALSGGNRFFVSAGTTKAPELAEAHRKYLDIQYVVRGRETVGWAPLERCTRVGAFSEEKDIGMYAGDFRFLRIDEGFCYVAFPEDAHMPGRHLDTPSEFIKIVVKLKV